jgi:hypothetical protein
LAAPPGPATIATMTTTAAALALTTALIALPACYGSYGAFHKVHDWNGEVSDNKWIKSGVHLALWAIPVYELVLVGDFLIFNTIEHFTGKNPFGGQK